MPGRRDIIAAQGGFSKRRTSYDGLTWHDRRQAWLANGCWRGKLGGGNTGATKGYAVVDNTPKLTIRGLNSEDWSDIYTLLTIPSLLMNTVELPYLSEEAFRERINHNQAHNHTLIAETTLPSGRKRVIGAGLFRVMTNMRRRHTGELTLLVHPDSERTDVAEGLLTAVCELADRWLGLRRVQTIVFVEDQSAVELFTAAGFEREATLRRYARRAGQLSDGLLLARLNPLQTLKEEQA